MTHEDDLVYPRRSQPYSGSWDSWVQKWWHWCFGPKATNSPIEDTSGSLCLENQNNPYVWFIGATFGGIVKRHCTVPSGKCIFLPAIANFISYAEYPDLKTEGDLTDYAKLDLDTTTFANVTIDDHMIQKSEEYRVRTKPFAITIPADISNDVVIMSTIGVSDGYWTFLKPLSTGFHVIHIQSEKSLFDDVQHGGYKGENGMFKTEATYFLSIE